MALTSAQATALRTDILANSGEFGSLPQNSDGAFEIAAAYNLTATPEFWVWRAGLPFSEIYGLTSPAPTNGTWNWTFYSGMNAGEQGAWMEMGGPNRELVMSRPNVRAGVSAIFTGPQGGAALASHILALGRRLASRAEKLFASGTGSTASPATMGFEGQLFYNDVKDAMGW